MAADLMIPAVYNGFVRKENCLFKYTPRYGVSFRDFFVIQVHGGGGGVTVFRVNFILLRLVFIDLDSSFLSPSV